MRTLTVREQRLLLYGGIGIGVYLLLFGGYKLGGALERRSAAYHQLVADARELKQEKGL
jgi:hypothetical protein